jgi:hypothetical protein
MVKLPTLGSFGKIGFVPQKEHTGGLGSFGKTAGVSPSRPLRSAKCAVSSPPRNANWLRFAKMTLLRAKPFIAEAAPGRPRASRAITRNFTTFLLVVERLRANP